MTIDAKAAPQMLAFEGYRTVNSIESSSSAAPRPKPPISALGQERTFNGEGMSD